MNYRVNREYFLSAVVCCSPIDNRDVRQFSAKVQHDGGWMQYTDQMVRPIEEDDVFTRDKPMQNQEISLCGDKSYPWILFYTVKQK